MVREMIAGAAGLPPLTLKKTWAYLGKAKLVEKYKNGTSCEHVLS